MHEYAWRRIVDRRGGPAHADSCSRASNRVRSEAWIGVSLQLRAGGRKEGNVRVGKKLAGSLSFRTRLGWRRRRFRSSSNEILVDSDAKSRPSSVGCRRKLSVFSCLSDAGNARPAMGLAQGAWLDNSLPCSTQGSL